MTSPDRPRRDPRRIVEAAADVALVPVEAAALSLSSSPTDVWSLVQAGELAGVVSAGRLYVFDDELDAIALGRLRAEREAATQLAGPYTDALCTYLARTPATGDPDEAQREGRPLVTTRRGPRRTNGGLAAHGVLVSARALAAFVGDCVARAELEDGGEARYGPWRRLPAGPALLEGLQSLHGVSAQHNATGITDPARTSRRLYGYVRVDPVQYPPSLSDELRDLVENSERARRAAAERAAPAAVPSSGSDDPWADVE